MHTNNFLDDSVAGIRIATKFLFIAMMSTSIVHAQPASPGNDPVAPGIMQGFPPSADKIVTKENTFRSPNLRWALQNTRLMSPTANIQHARQPMPLPADHAAGLDKMQFIVGDTTVTLAEYLQKTHTDGFIVVHRGRVIYERYFDSFTPDQPHAWASMTKSVTGLMAAQLIDEGKLDPNAKLSEYVPELVDNPFGNATIQQNLDMEVPVSYPSALPPDLGLFGAVGIAPRRDGAPDSIYDFLKVVRQTPNTSAGSVFYYQNGSPEAVAWAIRRITGKSWSKLTSESLWQYIAQDDGYVVVDRIATEMASGGLHSTLRDAARFAELVRAGLAGGSSPFPGSAIRLALTPIANQEKFAKGNVSAGRPGYSYHDYWYQVNDGNGSIMAGGRFGQAILVNPKAELTIVKFSSAPDLAPRAISVEAGKSSVQRSPLQTAEALTQVARAILTLIK